MKNATPMKANVYSSALVQASLKKLEHEMAGWPSWKVASMSSTERGASSPAAGMPVAGTPVQK